MLGLVDVPSWLLLTVGIILLVLWYSSIKLSHFKKLGIPGPKPLPILGNVLDLLFSDMAKLELKYKKEHGPVIGLYTGFTPSTLIFDKELIMQVMVKHFDNFTNRHTVMTKNEMVTHLKDDRWKHVRSVMSPTFTSSKLKQMVGEIHRCAIQLTENLTSTAGPIDLMESSGNFAIDAIASTAFGLRLDSQNSKNSAFVVNAKKASTFSPTNRSIILAAMFPMVSSVLQRMFAWSPIDNSARVFFINIIKQTLGARDESSEKRNDFLQLLCDASRGAKDYGKEDGDEVENLSANTTKKGLTEGEVNANAFIFFLGGYDTIHTSITMLLYCLANNIECQQKLIEEIDSVIGDKESISYDDVMQMHYLDQCMHESLRLFPPFHSINRGTKEDIDINGVSFKKGTCVTIPIYAIHHDPEIWNDPEKFDPERFSQKEKAKRHPMLWQAFGFGPRQCIAKRLSTYELKAAIVHILRKLTISTCEKMPIQWKRSGLPKSVWITTKKRK